MNGDGPETFHEIDRWGGGLGWIAYPDEYMERASHAVVTDEGVWVIDPIDVPGLDERLAALGEVVGVTVLLNRHTRDAEAVADRHGVPVTLVGPMESIADEIAGEVETADEALPGTSFRAKPVINLPFWTEIALFDGETLVVGDSLGTARYFLAGGERLGVHPTLRLTPPRDAFSGIEPARVLVGHGHGLMENGGVVLRDTLFSARRRIPGLLGTWARMAIGRGP